MSIPLFPARYFQVIPFTSKADAEALAIHEKQRGNDCFVFRTGSVDLFDAGGSGALVGSSSSLKWVVVLWRSDVVPEPG